MENYHTNNENKSGRKTLALGVAALAVIALGAAGLYLVDVDQTKEARFPDVDVTMTEGQMPAYDVDVADVSVDSETVDVSIPALDVETETKTIEVDVPVDADAYMTDETVSVPTLNIERPDTDDPADKTDDNT